MREKKTTSMRSLRRPSNATKHCSHCGQLLPTKQLTFCGIGLSSLIVLCEDCLREVRLG